MLYIGSGFTYCLSDALNDLIKVLMKNGNTVMLICDITHIKSGPNAMGYGTIMEKSSAQFLLGGDNLKHSQIFS